MRRTAHLVFLFILLVLAGCNGGNGGSAPPSRAAGGNAGQTTVRAALVLDTGGVDDKSFNAGAWAGLQRAMKDLHVDGKYVESNTPADYKTNLTQLASADYNLVFAVGYKMEDALKEVAPQFPHVKFAIVDSSAPAQPNCAGLLFKEEQGTFLAGFLAASMSKTKKIGFVGGEEIALIKKFEAGYRAGAKTADPNVTVLTTYTGDWNDLNKGKSDAEQEFGNGADIIFHAAGKAGLGVIEAAKEKGSGFYAIGVDQDQDWVAPGRVLTSMVKHVDNAVFDIVQRDQAGHFEPGDHVYDLKQNGVGLSEMKYTRKDIPPDVLARLQKLTQMIADGQVTPPTTVEAVANFQPPQL